MSVATWLPPLPVTVRRKLWVSSSVVTGAVKVACAALLSASVPPAPAVWVQERVTFLPQGSSKPFAASASPRVTVPPEATSIPPSGPAFAIGLKRALPGLSFRISSISTVSFSKIRGGSDERSL